MVIIMRNCSRTVSCKSKFLNAYICFVSDILYPYPSIDGVKIFIHQISAVTNIEQLARGFVVRHVRFAENYIMYSRSHFVKGLELMLLLVVSELYGDVATDWTAYILLTSSMWFFGYHLAIRSIPLQSIRI